MLISQVLFWLSVVFVMVSPTPELMNILILVFCQSISWLILILVMVRDGKIKINTSVADGLVILTLIVAGLSTVLAKNVWLSFWGHGSSIGYSFVSFAILASSYFYVRLTLHAIKAQMMVHSILISLITIIGWYSFAGQFLKLPMADLVGGSMLTSQIFLVISFVVFLISALSKQSRVITIISSIVVAIDLIALIITNSTALLLIILLFLLLLIILPVTKKTVQNIPSLIIIFGLGLLVLAAILLPIRFWLHQSPLLAINLPWLMHWPIVKGVLADSALFGYGMGNFSQAFYVFKPLSYNLLPFFNLGMTQARHLPLELLTTTGMLGLGSVIAFTVSVLNLAWKRAKNSGEAYAHNLMFTWIIIIFVSLVAVPSVSLLLLIMIMSAIIINKPQLFESSIALRKGLKFLLLYGGMLGIVSMAYYFIHFKSASLYLFSIDDNKEHQLLLIPKAKRAISLLPNEMEHKVTYANLLMLKNETIAEDDIVQIKKIYQQSSVDANNFEDLSMLASSVNIYVNKTQDTQVPMQEILNKMISLDANNPEYPYQRAIGFIKQAQSLYIAEAKIKPYDHILSAINSAQGELIQAIALKSNYQEAMDLLDQIKDVQIQIEEEQVKKIK